MTKALLGYEEVADFVASLAPEKVVKLKASQKVQERLEELMSKKKSENLSQEEKYEMDRYLALDHLIALAKARTRIRLAA